MFSYHTEEVSGENFEGENKIVRSSLTFLWKLMLMSEFILMVVIFNAVFMPVAFN